MTTLMEKQPLIATQALRREDDLEADARPASTDLSTNSSSESRGTAVERASSTAPARRQKGDFADWSRSAHTQWITTAPVRETRYVLQGSSRTEHLEEADHQDQTSGALANGSGFAMALGALRRVAYSEPDEETWLDAYRRLRTTAVAEEFRAPRHAALALVISDALAFSTPDQVDAWDEARRPMLRGFKLLLQPFIPVSEEKGLLKELLETRWLLTPPFEAAAFASLESELAD